MARVCSEYNELNGAVPNATYLEVALISKPLHPGPFQQHAHSVDEYILTKSCAIFVPKGVYHYPFVFH